jgi:membrane protein
MSEAQRSPDHAERAGWRQRLARLPQAVLNYWIVRRVMAITQAANAVAGPLLAAALAFVTMFAILPGLLLLSGVLGWLIEDPAARADLLARLVAAVPPLEEAMADSLEGVVRERGALSLVGLVGLIWGASAFYESLDEVMRRLFPGGAVRGFVQRRLRGALAIIVLVVLAVGTVALSSLWALLATFLGDVQGAFLLRLLGPAISLLVMIAVVLIVYRYVPTAPPSLRAALLPAVAAGAGIGLLTNLFTLLAPLLIGGLAGFGILAALFGAFIWLNYCFQMLIYGAAWARYRRDRENLAGSPAAT